MNIIERPSVHPFCFGPKLWSNIDVSISGLSEILSHEEIESFIMLMKSLRYLIPCNECRSSYNVFSREDDTNIENVDNYTSISDITNLIFHLRNKVNKKIGINYYITQNYYNVKIYAIRNLCEKNMDHVMCSMYNAPFISDDIINSVIQYVREKHNEDISYIIEYKKNIVSFMEGITIEDINFKNSSFKKMYSRNKKCLKIRDKIYGKMLSDNYDYAKSFIHDNDLYVEMFKECCFIFKEKVLVELLKN